MFSMAIDARISQISGSLNVRSYISECVMKAHSVTESEVKTCLANRLKNAPKRKSLE